MQSSIIHIPDTERFPDRKYTMDLSKDPEGYRLVASYGTLCKDMRNFRENQGLYLCNFETTIKGSFVLFSEQFLPGVIFDGDHNYEKNPIRGQLFLVSPEAKKRMDFLEGSTDRNGFYYERDVPVKITETEISGGLLDLPPYQQATVRRFLLEQFDGLEIENLAHVSEAVKMYCIPLDKAQKMGVKREVVVRRGDKLVGEYDYQAASLYKSQKEVARERGESVEERLPITPDLSGLDSTGTDHEQEQPRIPSRDRDEGDRDQPPPSSLSPNP